MFGDGRGLNARGWRPGARHKTERPKEMGQVGVVAPLAIKNVEAVDELTR